MAPVPEVPDPLDTAVAVYRGERFLAFDSTLGRDHMTLLTLPGAPAPDGFQPASNGRFERDVPKAELTALYVDSMKFTWRGQPFSVNRIEGDRVLGTFGGRDFGWAKENGLAGDYYNGVVDWFDLADVQDLHVERKDLLPAVRPEQGS